MLASKQHSAVLALLFGVLIALFFLRIPISLVHPIDFGHYLSAAERLLQGDSPYSVTEFFAVPWFAMILVPLTAVEFTLASRLWLFLNLVSMMAAARLTLGWLDEPFRRSVQLILVLGAVCIPAALYVYITGQVSAIVLLGLLLAITFASESMMNRHVAIVVIACILMSFKPHIILIPAIFLVLEWLRWRNVRLAIVVLVSFSTLAGISFLLLPGWVGAYIAALQGGAYFGGPGLAARGFAGWRTLGVHWWIFVPMLLYTIIAWWRCHLSKHVMSLFIVTNLLLIPYSRAYDQVLLLLPALVVLGDRGARRLLLPGLLSFLALIVLPWTDLAILAPCLMGIALLLQSEGFVLREGVKKTRDQSSVS